MRLRWKLARQVRLRQHQRSPGILEHVREALGRIRRIQRHIGAAGFQHGEQRQHHLEGALGKDTDQNIRPHAFPAQETSQLIGASVHLCIAEGLSFKFERNRIRCLCRLPFNQPMQSRLMSVIARRIIPLHQNLAAFGIRKHIQTTQRGSW